MSPLDSIGRFGASPVPAVGQPLPRVDGAVKVAGKARFAAEVDREGLVYAALVYSTIARGNIDTIDTTAAEAAPGVVFVMTYKNAPRLSEAPPFMSNPRAVGASTHTIMQDSEILWNGQPVAVVLADTQEQADFAAGLVWVTYKEKKARTQFDQAKASPRELQHIMGEKPWVRIGDAEKALKRAATSVDVTYRTPKQNHCAIELHAATLYWEGGKLTVHDATQMVNGTAHTLAKILGVKEEDVRVVSPFVGGGFGSKGLWDHQIVAAAAAKVSGRPVRIVLSRKGVFRTIGGRTLTEQRVALGAKADGTLAALIHTGTAGMTEHNYCPEQFTFPARHLYAADTFLIGQNVADLDMVANTFMRAPGESVGTFALESAIDELADKLAVDPIALRRRWEPEKDPTSGKPFSARHLLEAYARGAEKFGWDKRNVKPGARQEGEWLIGMGVATATYPYMRMPGGAARICINADGRAVVQMASHEMGMGTATAQAQHAADLLGLKFENVTFEYGDTDLPSGTLAGGSSQSASIAAAVIAAAKVLFTSVIKLAGNDSPLAGLSVDEVVARDGGLCAKDDAGRCESYASILRRAGQQEVSAHAEAPEAKEQQEYSMHSTGAIFCEVGVNAVTGEIRVRRVLGSFDTGRIINPRTAASQFRGGIVMGLGLALMEETLFDERNGRIMNPSLAEYHVPVHMDVPEIDVMWTDIPDPCSPAGVRGIGEIGITGVGAAVANAVFNATGKRVRELPITLDKVF
jgi:xanthine dehydrogenase YagR molybdenum-binding subunit